MPLNDAMPFGATPATLPPVISASRTCAPAGATSHMLTRANAAHIDGFITGLPPLHPHVVTCGQRPACVTSVDHTAWLDDERMTFAGRPCDVFHTLGHDEHLSRADHHRAVSKADLHLSIEDDECFVG